MNLVDLFAEIDRREKYEVIYQMSADETRNFRAWLERPNAGFYDGRVGIEAVSGGGLLFRLKQFQAGDSK